MLITMLLAQVPAEPLARQQPAPSLPAPSPAAATAATSAPVAQRWSILAPVPEAQCRERGKGDDIVVCATSLPNQQLPYPELAKPARPQPSNPDLTGIGALRATDAAVAATAGTSITGSGGGGLPLLQIALFGLKQAAKGVKKLTTHVDKSKRVAIDLSDPAPPGAAASPAPPASGSAALPPASPGVVPAAPSRSPQ